MTSELPENLKVTLDAQTDQAVMAARELRTKLTEDQADVIVEGVAHGMALHLAAQFPGQQIARVVMAVAQSLKSLNDEMTAAEVAPTASTLALIAVFVAEELDRGES